MPAIPTMEFSFENGKVRVRHRCQGRTDWRSKLLTIRVDEIDPLTIESVRCDECGAHEIEVEGTHWVAV